MRLVYVIGVPGVGKTTTVRGAVGPGIAGKGAPFAYQLHEVGGELWHQLGAERPAFSGTDALSLSVQPKVLTWLGQVKPSRVIAEGDRLANEKFFVGVQMLGYALQVVLLTAPVDVVVARRRARGSHQNATWLQGRVTKVERLASSCFWPVVTISTFEGDAVAALRKILQDDSAHPQ